MRSILAVVIILSSVTGCCRSKEEIASEEKVAEAKKAEKKAKLAELKKRCGDAYGTNAWESTCRDLVKEKLFQPSSADFSYLGATNLENERDCKQFYSSTVESKNAFGATIKHEFRCQFDTKKNWVTLEFIKLGG